jgi:hypothetical protein
MVKYITWNNFCIKSINKAEKQKFKLECNGYTLIHESLNCLTYKKEG